MFAAIAAAILMPPADNVLTAAEKKAGFKLLFDGKTTKGWHNFKAKGVRPGWKVINGALTIADPGTAGDIVTDGKYANFELQVDFNFEPGQNSGIMYHVADTGEATWHSGPEIQIYDSEDESQERTGQLYQLYKPAKYWAKPAGEWNHFKIVVDKKLCYTELNGHRLYEYDLWSEEFAQKVAFSKFGEHKEFAKLKSGTIAIQGDHGKVAFKNIKIRVIK